MKKQLNLLFSILIILLCYSCNDREGMAGEEGIFILDASEIQNLTNNQFVMATDPITGEVLYWETGLSFEKDIRFAVETETVDVTTGGEYGSGFDITTYRDVQSGFKLSGFTFQCYAGQVQFDPLGIDSVELIIDGTAEITEIVSPFYDLTTQALADSSDAFIREKVTYDHELGKTIIRGKFRNDFKDLQFALRFVGDSVFKSLIIPMDDWRRVDVNMHRIEVDQTDFATCRVHEVDLGHEINWLVDAEIETKTGARITIANWTTYAQTQKGKAIKLFIDDRIDLAHLHLSVRSSFTREGFKYQQSFTAIPTSLPIIKYEAELIEPNPNSFAFANSDEVDLIELRYEYKNGNNLSHWDIYQPASSTSTYKLPIIESEFLDETVFIKNVLSNPEYLRIQTYNIDEGIKDIYSLTGINRQLKCLDFNSSYESWEF